MDVAKEMIVVKDLCKSYGSHEVLRHLSLTVHEAETVVILGRSGVGKSVLLKQILGIEQPDSGTIAVDGTFITGLKGQKLRDAMRGMGMLFQGSALFDSMTVGENTAFALHQHGTPGSGEPYSDEEIKERVNEALAMVDLEGTQDKMPSDLSGGMRKRAALARMIVYRPKIVLYDEPTTGLDPITAMQINRLIVATCKELSATSIVVTHDIRSALEVGDRLALHHDGKIAIIDKKEHFFTNDNPLLRAFFDNVSLARFENS
jgi:phospholipid/cholesterol/gamma-HCH transport system ATP-binding protein